MTLGIHKTDNRKTTSRKGPFVCVDMPAWESHGGGAMEKSQVAGLHCLLSFRTECSAAFGLLEKDITQRPALQKRAKGTVTFVPDIKGELMISGVPKV